MIKPPPGETPWVGYYDTSGVLRYLVTSKAARDYYYLYECVGDGLTKLGRDKDPSVLVNKLGVREKILKPAKH